MTGKEILLDFHESLSKYMNPTNTAMLPGSLWMFMNDFSGQTRTANTAIVDGILVVRAVRMIMKGEQLHLDYGPRYRGLDPNFYKYKKKTARAPTSSQTGDQQTRGNFDLSGYQRPDEVDQVVPYFDPFAEIDQVSLLTGDQLTTCFLE
jgi:hypothetical protein